MIYEEYIKEKILRDWTEEKLNSELLKSIIETKNELITANNNYEYAEGELIDYYLYQIKATQSKLNYLIKLAKKNGIILERTEEIQIRKEQQSNVV